MTRIPEESKERWYFIGMSFTRYSQSQTDFRNTWYGQRLVVEKIKELLEDSNNKLQRGKGRQYRLQIRNQSLHEQMTGHQLDVPKKHRVYPHVPNSSLDHFIRGLYDSHVSVTGKKMAAQFYYPNIDFKKSLNKDLCDHTGIKPDRIIDEGPFTLRGDDLVRLYDFIYKDWNYINHNRLYLEHKWNRF